jgi:hypothetical protein
MRLPDNPYWDNETIPEQIWSIADAILLKTYDETGWTTHSYASSANTRISQWATWGTTYPRNLDIKKLHIGCAFYGWSSVVGSSRVSYATYSGGSFKQYAGNTGDYSRTLKIQ